MTLIKVNFFSKDTVFYFSPFEEARNKNPTIEWDFNILYLNINF